MAALVSEGTTLLPGVALRGEPFLHATLVSLELTQLAVEEDTPASESQRRQTLEQLFPA